MLQCHIYTVRLNIILFCQQKFSRQTDISLVYLDLVETFLVFHGNVFQFKSDVN